MARKGQKLSQEARNRISEGMLLTRVIDPTPKPTPKRQMTQGFREKNRQARLGKKQSPETKAKRAATLFAMFGSISRKTPTYSSWHMMKQRCLNPNDPRYKDYGGRGITIWGPWLDYKNFLADMGERPGDRHPSGRFVYSLDRVDNAKGYEPENCKWSTSKEQAANKRPMQRTNQNGGGVILSEWSQLQLLDPVQREGALVRLREVGLTPQGREVFTKVRDKLQDTISALEQTPATEITDRVRVLLQFVNDCLAIEKVDTST